MGRVMVSCPRADIEMGLMVQREQREFRIWISSGSWEFLMEYSSLVTFNDKMRLHQKNKIF